MRLALFDLDDTAYDRTRLRPEAILPSLGLPLGPHRDVTRTIHDVIAAGPLFGKLGLPDLRHHPESPGMMAVLLLLHGSAAGSGGDGRVPARLRAWARRAIRERAWLVAPHVPDRWPAALLRGLALRRFLRGHRQLEELGHHLRRLERGEEARRWGRLLARRQSWELYDGFLETWASLVRSGAHCFIASEGEERVQRAKLRRLGLEELLPRLVTTERAARPRGARALRRQVASLMDLALSGRGRALGATLDAYERSHGRARAGWAAGVPEELLALYPFQWALDRASEKGVAFYARALHGAVLDPRTPLAPLDHLETVEPARWRAARVQLVMIGDNFAKDVAPLQRLLGPRGAWTCLLRIGRHNVGGARRNPSRPARSFEDWRTLGRYFRRDFGWSRVPAIREAPALLAGVELPGAALEAAAHSRYTVVRALARSAPRRGT